MTDQITAADVLAALQREEFTPVLQPIVHLPSGRLVALEMLARWRSPHHGDVSPEVFIDLMPAPAQLNSLLMQLLGKVAGVIPDLPRHLKVSLNVAPCQLESGQFALQFGRLLQEKGLQPDRFHLELTETQGMTDLVRVRSQMQKMVSAGVAFALDDFGTGCSGLSRLQGLPFNAIKIDACFVSGLAHNAKSQPILANIIALGKALGMRVVAEGIETDRQAEILRRLGCEFGQGYFFSAPIRAARLRAMLTAFSPPDRFKLFGHCRQHAGWSAGMSGISALAGLVRLRLSSSPSCARAD